MLVCPNCGQENPGEARYCLACGTPLEAVAEPKESRRHVTLVFTDLVGSTTLGERTDPETVRRVISTMHARWSRLTEGRSRSSWVTR